MLPLKIAFRFLFASKLQTVLIMVGIGIGVSVQIFIGSLIDGLQDDLLDSTIGNQPHITISAPARNERLDDDMARFQTIQDFDDDFTATARTLEGPANILGDETDPVVIRGFDYEEAQGIYGFSQRLQSGRLAESDDEVVIGKDLFQLQDLSLNDTVQIFFPDTQTTKDVTVVGVFDLGVASLNETWVVPTLEGAKALFDTEQISAYEIQIHDVFASEDLRDDLAEVYPGLSVSEWQANNQDLLGGLQGQSVSSVMIQVFVMISVVLGIASVLAITVLQKSRQLGILKAMGITDKRASLIFLSQGFILGVLGAIIGVLFGLFLTWSFTTFAVGPDGEPVVSLLIDPWFILLSASIAISASVIASIIPAFRGAKLSVIEVIRNG